MAIGRDNPTAICATLALSRATLAPSYHNHHRLYALIIGCHDGRLLQQSIRWLQLCHPLCQLSLRPLVVVMAVGCGNPATVCRENKAYHPGLQW